ncbi:L-threonate dehydrogenase [Oceanomicrobium pacificus]|uniref:L-threonate dehydrogenase n=1 Tax=Oceanomicrobium pacificus TaxID=2692916 RepID=A0A6B0TKN7_9RHOB|nr:L-threonate dehydrogenase [Oceanomicrobium pacificus]MXU65047.1 NAD-binding protein [Oceanomicrobium pacificus]
MENQQGSPLKVAVIGLGSMGYGMAQSALRGGHRVWGSDIARDQVDRFRAEGGEAGPLAVALPELDVIALVVLNAAQTEDVLFGTDGVARHLRPGAVILSCATVAPAFAREMAARSAELGLLYLDAPISGGAVKAASGALTIMASGPEAGFSAAGPLLDCLAERVFRLGDAAGAGSAMKAVNQLLAGVHIAAMAEALTFGLSQGITPDRFLDVIPQCAGTSWMLENRAPHIVEGDYTPRSAVDIWPKDLGIVREIAGASGCRVPLADAALARFREASAAGLGREDDAAVAKIYAREAGLDLPGDG